MINRNRSIDEVKDRYFFIDYLRLHRFGRQNQVWKKNRNMLVKEHEYNNNHEIRSRKGYQSYIQRCVKSILDWMYPEWDIFKPRNRFAYEIGRKNDQDRGMLDLDSAEDKIKYVIQRNLMNNCYEDIIEEYRTAINDSVGISLKNRDAGLVVNLDAKRSMGYRAIKNIKKIKEIQDRMISLVDNEFYINMLANGLTKACILEKGTKVTVTSQPGSVYEIRESRMDTHYRGISLIYEVVDENGRRANYRPSELTIIRENQVPNLMRRSVSPVLDRVIEYANENFSTTTGINSEAIFNLSRAAIVRELLAEESMELATELRRVEPTSHILSQISVNHEIDEEDEENYN